MKMSLSEAAVVRYRYSPIAAAWMVFAGMLIAFQPAKAIDAQTRRDELAAVGEQLSDPDPLMRRANMEEIVRSGDADRIQIALKLAFSSDDASMRSLAMRAYFAQAKRVSFDISLPPQVQKQYDAAEGDTRKLEELFRASDYVRRVSAVSFRIQVIINKYDFNKTDGVLSTTVDRDKDFSISGDRFSTIAVFPFGYTCELDARPTRILTLEGTLTCPFGAGAPKLNVSAPLF